MVSAIESEIGGVFIPVSNIEAARDWYCHLLGRPADGDIPFGHLYVIAMKGSTALVLDSKGFVGPHVGKPVFHFNADDLSAAHAHVSALDADNVSPITDGAFFTFNDPDGNLLMVANVPPAPRFEDE
ncbi:VOC family protein [Sinorhizobium mexicanum]|uniref:VOC family protein n=1 Tax=Sinorhizobium mexicanum TaxID=375549 RepID=A0A859QP27_9HYPH|nr:VOC family protein [Sinorhizobium mexicanum]MBP1882480.1 catechol 2,3-dioxygenase-like lactoylglutathione lyase family enzyme [Sinorhizobium mexicanum]QLL62166.1 VOC family protein [Sinorhizobium mexicanum]